MDRTLLVLAVSFSLLVSAPIGTILANEGSDSQDAQRAAKEINDESDSDSGRAAVAARLQNEFHVEASVINDLRSKKMGYGEIGIVLSLAKQMPGGITNANIQKIMNLRQGEGKTGWGNVAKELNLNLGKAVSQAKEIAHERQANQRPDIDEMRSEGESQPKFQRPDTTEKHAEEASEPKFQRPASAGKPEGFSNPMPTPGGGGRGRK